MAKVSIVIPLYNKAGFISRALESVFAQTFNDYEVIVIDDGSTDEGPEIVKQFKDKRLRLIRQQNGGPGAARNRAISESFSELLAFLDADDQWMPQFLERSVNALQDYPNCDMTASAYYLGKDKTDISSMFKKRGAASGPWQVEKNMSIKDLMTAYYLLNSWAILCRREVVENYGGFRTENNCDYGEDTYLWLQVMFNHNICRVIEPLVWYHSEVSQLGPGRKDKQPLQSFLTSPEPIRQSCRPENREMLERFLAGFALAAAHHRALNNGDIQDVRYLIDTFPLMKKFRSEYAKLRLKIAMPGLVPIVRSLKK